MKNLHNVEFKIKKNGPSDYRVESYQGGVFWTDREFTTVNAAFDHRKTLSEYYERNVGAYLFIPEPVTLVNFIDNDEL